MRWTQGATRRTALKKDPQKCFSSNQPAHQIAIGMYISKLDRPWVETPFMFQGFLVKEEKEIKRLQEYCEHVYIDIEKGKAPDPELTGRAPPKLPEDITPAPIPKPRVKYEVEVEVEEELEVAQETHEQVTEAVGNLMEDVRAGKAPQITDVKQSVTQMEESILRNPDAFMWLRRLKKKDTYTYSHCIDCSVLAIAFGRQMGLPRVQIQALGVGAMMFDVGKMRLPAELLAKPEALTVQEFNIVKQHVEYRVEIMKGMRGISQQSVAMAATHHERFDGSGYPGGLSGGDIPLMGRMAAIVDCFDAITSNRPYADAVSPTRPSGISTM